MVGKLANFTTFFDVEQLNCASPCINPLSIKTSIDISIGCTSKRGYRYWMIALLCENTMSYAQFNINSNKNNTMASV